MNRLLKGLKFNISGLSYLGRHRELWRFILIPWFINTAFFVVLIVLYVSFFSEIFAIIAAPLAKLAISQTTGFFWQVLDSLLWLVRGILSILLVCLSLIVMFVLVFMISALVNSPFYEAMADRIVGAQAPARSPLFNLAHSLKIELYKFSLFLSLFAVFFALSFLPGIGIFFLLLSYVFSAWAFAFGLATYPMVSGRAGFSQMLAWGRAHGVELVGFGLPATIPLFGLLILPLQVVGGTLLYQDLEASEKN